MTRSRRPGCEVQLDPEGVEALARRLAELMGAQEPEPRREQLMSAAEVAEWWGVARRWIYEHADELGVRRLGSGARPRLRFDPAQVAESLGDPPGWGGEGDVRRLPRVGGDRKTDSLSPPRRAMLGRQARKRPGRRANAPDPAPIRRRNEEAIRKERSRCSSCPVAGRPGGRRWRVGPKVKSKCASGRVAAATRFASTPTASVST